jgi:hypothetical protein
MTPMQALAEVVRCLSFARCQHCGRPLKEPPGDCDLVDHAEAYAALEGARPLLPKGTNRR